MRRCLAAVVMLAVACGQTDAPSESLPLMTLTPEAPATTAAATTTSAPTTPTSTDPAPAATAAEPQAAVVVVDPTRLTVAPEVWGGYDRDLFPHWSDSDGDGCDTRQEVLIRDSAIEPAMHPERVCRVVAGEWWSAYDDWWTTDPAELHIDHLVPLAEAWESGARLWNEADREAFANDTAGLVAVSASANTAKGASDPADWLPPNEDVWCTYAAVWVEHKATWNLTADQSEYDTLAALALECNTPASS
ncbi:MAG: HNH endonuclease [Chloroflexi bacterium]|nr:HNH endonuclease [Chloroflexota bacterium]